MTDNIFGGFDFSFDMNADDDDWLGDLLSPDTIDEESPMTTLQDDGTLEKIADAELSEMARFVKQEKKKQLAKLNLAADTDYYFCVVFQSEEQRNKFLAESGWAKHLQGRFINGLSVAKEMGIKIEFIDLPLKKATGLSGKLFDVEVL